jgi:hypothetical protein
LLVGFGIAYAALRIYSCRHQRSSSNA